MLRPLLMTFGLTLLLIACGRDQPRMTPATPGAGPSISEQEHEPASADGERAQARVAAPKVHDGWEDDDPILRFVGSTALEQPSIQHCLRQWPNHPFSGEQRLERLFAAVNVMGQGGGVKDHHVSPEPRFLLVKAAVNVMGATHYELLNPNGYYCIEVMVNVGATVALDVHCDAHISAAAVAVGVQGRIEPVANVDVNVGSRVRVNRVDDDGRPCAESDSRLAY